MQIHPDDVAEFRDKIGILTEFEGFDPMRLEPMGLPDAMHDPRTDLLRPGHRPDTPVRGIGRGGVQGRIDDRLDLVGRHGAPPARPRRILEQADDARLPEPVAPQIDGRPTHAQLVGDGVDRGAVGRGQDDPRAGHHALRRLTASHQGFQAGSLRRAERHLLRWVPHATQRVRLWRIVKLFTSHYTRPTA